MRKRISEIDTLTIDDSFVAEITSCSKNYYRGGVLKLHPGSENRTHEQQTDYVKSVLEQP